jgi:uncharacterized membrane protein YdfJ with MMPL/SSD domain
MFQAWGRLLYTRRRLTLGLTLVLVAFAVVWGTGVFGQLSSGDDFTPPASPSQQEASQASQVFGRNDADVVVLYRSAGMTVSDPGYQRAVTAALAGLPRADVTRVSTYWSTGSSSLVSTDRHATYAVLQLTGADDAARHKTYDAIKTELTPPGLAASGVTARVGGTVPMEVAINSEVTADIAKAEGFSMPVLLLLLLVIFGSLAAASLPVAIGGVAILGSFTVLRLLTMVTTVSIYSVNITTILGLGLGIDYGLFMVTRFREELRRQPTVEQAVARTVATAGRTIAVSGVTVAVALTSLMLFPEDFLRSMGYGGVATVAVDMLAALTVLPALLAVLGHRVNALRIRRAVARPAVSEDSGAWYRLARSVMRRPLVYVTVIVIGLLALGAPFLRISWGGTDARTLPAASVVRQVSEALDTEFPVNSTAPIEALVTGARAATPAELTGYLHRIDAIPGVTGAEVTGTHVTPNGAGTVRVDIGYAPPTVSSAARGIVARIRAIPPPPGTTVLVGGTTAGLVDELASLGAALDGPPGRRLHVRAAVPGLWIGGTATEGDRDERVVAVGDVRRRRVDLPVGSPVRPAAVHADRVHRPDDADPDAGGHLRPVHGLRGVPAVPDPRAVRPDRRQHRLGGGRPGADRRPDHSAGAAADHRGRRVLGLRHHVHQADGRRHDRGPAGGRHRRPGAPGAGHHAAARPGQLVGAAAAAPPVRPVRDQGGSLGCRAGPG